MAKKINEQYDEIFKIVGDKVGFRNFNYKDYLNLKEKKSDDTRLKNFDKYIEENLPFKEATDEEFKDSMNILNNGLREEDKVTDSKSFFKVGDLIPKKDEERKASKPSPTKTEVRKEKKISLFKRITQNIPAGAIGASVASVGLSALTLMLGSYAGWPAAAMLGTFNLTFVIPQAIILSYVGIKYLSKKIKDGSVKRWFENRKSKKLERELEKTKAKEKEFEKVSSELFPTTKDFADVVRESSKEETSGVASEPLPESFKFVPPVPVLEKPKKEEKIDDVSKDSIETEFVDKEPIDSGSEEETTTPDDVKKEETPSGEIEETTTDKVETEETFELKDDAPVRTPKHAMKKPVVEGEKEQLESRIKLLEWKLEQLSAPSLLPESEEKKQYIKQMKFNIKLELKKCKQEYKKFEERNISSLLRSRKATLSQKLKRIERNEGNQELISNIELAIEQIDNYLKLEELQREGLITEEQLNQKANNAYMIADYVLGESKGKK